MIEEITTAWDNIDQINYISAATDEWVKQRVSTAAEQDSQERSADERMIMRKAFLQNLKLLQTTLQLQSKETNL